MKLILSVLLTLAAPSFASETTPENSANYLTCEEYRPGFNDSCADFYQLCFGQEQAFCPDGFEPVARSFYNTDRLAYCYPSTVPVCGTAGAGLIVADCCHIAREGVNVWEPLPTDSTCSDMFYSEYDGVSFVVPSNGGAECGAWDERCREGICR